jgi:multidrug efflux system membrane fusion protein
MKTFRRILTILVLGAMAYGAWYVVKGQSQAPGQPAQQRAGGGRGANNPDQPVPVLAVPARNADVPVYLEGVGTTRALNMVTVRSLVDGTLLSVKFKEGQDVKKGDVLAQIDPTIYQAQVDQAVAKKALDEATLANAKVDLERYTNLVKTNAVTRQQLDTQRATVAQLEAQVRIDQGQIDNAKANLGYCTIMSPLDGRTGLRLVDQGNIVHASDVTGLVVITQIRPIAVVFTLPQQVLGRVNKAFAAGPLSVDAVDSDNKSVLDHGDLQVVNNQVDQATGTVQLKAEFPNPSLQLWPGQFVNVRLLIDTLKGVVVVPTSAVQRGPNGAFVYVVKPDNTVTVRQVTVGQQDERQAVVTSGLAAPDTVVTSGFVQLAEGRKVAVAAADTPAPGTGGNRPQRRGRTGAAAPDAAPGATTTSSATP